MQSWKNYIVALILDYLQFSKFKGRKSSFKGSKIKQDCRISRLPSKMLRGGKGN